MKCECCGGALMRCERCGKIIPKDSPKTKYCQKCAMDVLMERNREACRRRYKNHKSKLAKNKARREKRKCQSTSTSASPGNVDASSRSSDPSTS